MMAPPARSADRLEYPLIDILRALAALVVVVYHVIEVGGWTSFPSAGGASAFRFGWVGVDLFLVISGFVITLSASLERQRSPDEFRRRFMARRLRRIVPLYFVTSAIFVVVVEPGILSHGLRYAATQILSHALFVHNLHPSTHGAINGPSWSIALEMQFYVALVIAIPWLVERSTGKLAALMLVSWAYRYLTTLALEPGVAAPILQVIYASQLPGTLDEFGMGIALGLLAVKRPDLMSRLFARRWPNFLVCCALAAALSVLCWSIFLPRAGYWSHAGMIVFWRTLLALSFAAWVAVAISFPRPELLLLRPLRYLGTISYGIYLWHMPVLLTLSRHTALKEAELLATVLVVTLALAALSWHGFEKRLLIAKS